MSPAETPPRFTMSISGGLVTIFEGEELSHFAKAYKVSYSDVEFLRLDFRVQANSGDRREMALLVLLVPVESNSSGFPSEGRYSFGPESYGVRLGSLAYAQNEGPFNFIKLRFESKSLSVIITSSSESHLSGKFSVEMTQTYDERMLNGVRGNVELLHQTHASITFDLEVEASHES